MQFSIVIPAKNEESNIGRCIDSIRQMAWDSSQYEIIVVDNGSHDRTAEIAAQKGAKVYIEPGLNISALRNLGAQQAAGEILAFIDADCTVGSRWLCEAVTYLPREDIVCFGSPPVIPENATWVQRAWFEVRRKRITAGATDWLESMNMFVRREAFAECGGFDEELVTCEDYDLSLRLKETGLLVNDSRIIAVHHGEAATVAHFFRKEFWRGAGNFKGVMRHGVAWAELPSLVVPPAHCLLLFIAVSGSLLQNEAGKWVLVIFLLWQVTLFVLSLRKNEGKAALARVVQLYFLLNIYFLARGLAVFRGNSR